MGVVGLALGGGTGWLSRAYGLTANNVKAFEVVTADGRRLRADADTETECSGAAWRRGRLRS